MFLDIICLKDVKMHFSKQMELADTESDDLYDNGHEHNKIKQDDCISLKIQFSQQVWILICSENRTPTVFEFHFNTHIFF